jgi:hypothetical protein
MIKIEKPRAVVTFGNGDIKVTSALINGKGILALNNNEFHPIGSLCPTKETFKSILDESDILMAFENVKSIEVVILKLQEARALMIDTYRDNGGIEDITTIYEPNSKVDGSGGHAR